jgi:hypothetical protein
MPFDIATGTYSDAPSVLPLDASASPATAGVTPIASTPSPADQTPVMPYTSMLTEDMAAGEADARSAMSAGMDARNSMLSGYQAQALPLGGHVGDVMDLPGVPEQATGAAGGFLYPAPPETPGYFGGDVPGR